MKEKQKMNIKECYDYLCDRDNLSCFTECNNMIMNILLLKEIHDKLKKYETMVDEETDNHIYTLKQNFQNQFLKICNDFNTEYEKVITTTEINTCPGLENT
jgi:hypothetical protein